MGGSLEQEMQNRIRQNSVMFLTVDPNIMDVFLICFKSNFVRAKVDKVFFVTKFGWFYFLS